MIREFEKTELKKNTTTASQSSWFVEKIPYKSIKSLGIIRWGSGGRGGSYRGLLNVNYIQPVLVVKTIVSAF